MGHYVVARRVPAPAAQFQHDTRELHHAIGGSAACRELSTLFYRRVAQDPILRPLFPGKTFTCAIEEFTAFLVQFLGGPDEDSQRRWWLSLQESHRRFKIGQREREAWLGHMKLALSEIEIDAGLRDDLRQFFENASVYLVNRDSATGTLPEVTRNARIALRWEQQQALDEAVSAIRTGETARALALMEGVELRALLDRDRSQLVGLLGVMLGSSGSIRDSALERLKADPALVRDRFNGRTILHMAAAQGSSAVVTLLLTLGADPNAKDAGGHAPLYSVGNECLHAEGAAVVQLLVEAGARVNEAGGVTGCTALHMAARRGTVEVAAALIACGATVNVRDRRGQMPLVRALNCKQRQVAELLRTHGASPA